MDHVSVVRLLLMTLLTSVALALCPQRCLCDEDALHAACVGAGLDLVPILLNPELRSLNLTHNRIVRLDMALDFYGALQLLDLSANRIQRLGALNFQAQFRLLELRLNNNSLTSVTRDAFKGLRQLSTLDLSHNQIAEIAANAFVELRALHTLHLDHNCLVSFEPELFRHMAELRALYISSNQLLEVPTNALQFTRQLELLDLAANLIDSVEDAAFVGLPLRRLSLAANLISNLSLTAFEQLATLQHLDLSDNRLERVPTQQLAKLGNLTSLDLSGNRLVSIESLAFRSLFQLHTLRLSRLEHLHRIDPRAFVDNVNLEHIYLDSNPSLTTVPTRLFHGNMHMRFVSMHNNQLDSLAPDHFPLDRLTWLRLSGERYHCNCSLLWLWRLLREKHNASSFRLDGGHVRCQVPLELNNRLLAELAENELDCASGLAAALLGLALLATVLLLTLSVLAYRSRCLPGAANRHEPRRREISAPSAVPTPPTFYHHIQQTPHKGPHIVFV